MSKQSNRRSSALSGVGKAALPAAAKRSMESVERLLRAGQPIQAEQFMAGILLLAPEHPAVITLFGRILVAVGRHADAVMEFSRVVETQGANAALLELLAAAQSGAGDHSSAASTLQRACALEPNAQRWLKFGVMLDASGNHEEALVAADACLRLDPRHDRAAFLRARSLQALGRIADTADQYRQLIAQGRSLANAWLGLLDIKTVALRPDEQDALKRLSASRSLTDDERMKIDFALGRALEQAGQFAEAFEVFDRANQRGRQQSPWSAEAHHQMVDAIEQAFSLERDAADAQPSRRGEEVIFVVGLPRSGSTVVEQILSAHSRVEGSSELPDLALVLQAESVRRGAELSQWASMATPADWQRLGEEYLHRTERWRSNRPISTDKALDNWKHVGAIRLMLPGSVIIDSRRDGLETCWSCYKQLFAPGLARFTYSLSDLAAYWNDYRRLATRWQRGHPRHFRTQVHETLLTDPEQQIRELLIFCGLPFEPACLRPHESKRAVRTASSAQVREPMRQATDVAARYGNLLGDLRGMLA